MTLETRQSLTKTIKSIDLDILDLQRKKKRVPTIEHYHIDKLIFLHRKIKRSLEFEIERAEESIGNDQINDLVANDKTYEQEIKSY